MKWSGMNTSAESRRERSGMRMEHSGMNTNVESRRERSGMGARNEVECSEELSG